MRRCRATNDQLTVTPSRWTIDDEKISIIHAARAPLSVRLRERREPQPGALTDSLWTWISLEGSRGPAPGALEGSLREGWRSWRCGPPFDVRGRTRRCEISVRSRSPSEALRCQNQTARSDGHGVLQTGAGRRGRVLASASVDPWPVRSKLYVKRLSDWLSDTGHTYDLLLRLS